MGGQRTLHDIRTLRSVATRAMPSSEGATFLQLHRLASEKSRLEREVEMWLRKKEQIEKRIGEIEQQMERLRQLCPSVTVEARGNLPRRAWNQVSLDY